MGIGALVAWICGVDAERKSLEAIARPLSEVTHPIEPSVNRTR